MLVVFFCYQKHIKLNEKKTDLDLNLLRVLKKISTNFNMFKLFFHQRYFIFVIGLSGMFCLFPEVNG